jgi:HAD superfamily hydrolase (TIGR01509 family)
VHDDQENQSVLMRYWFMMETGMDAPDCIADLLQNDGPLPLIQGVLFDLDGTLIDSEPVYYESDQAFLARYGIDFTEELNETMFGWGAVDFFNMLQHLFPLSPLNRMPLTERLRLKDEAYLQFGKDRIRPFPGVAAFARLLVGRSVPVAIASGSSPLAIECTLGYAGLGDLFPVMVSTVDVPNGKPAPDIFLEAARRLGVDPSLCLVLEDSVPGVQAAKAAGMACIALPAPDASVGAKGRNPGFAPADMVVHGGATAFDPFMAGQAWRFG